MPDTTVAQALKGCIETCDRALRYLMGVERYACYLGGERMYYCRDCKHWRQVWAFRSDGHDRECGLCSMCLEDLSGMEFKDCEDLADFINRNYGLIDYSCGAEHKCRGYERCEDGERLLREASRA